MNWNYVYEEEHFDDNFYYRIGAISNGQNFLFYELDQDECCIFNSMSFTEETLECRFQWCKENEKILFTCLNSLNINNYCGEGSPIRNLEFLRV